MDLDAVADELYVVPPSQFVNRRAELAAAAQRSGDKATAAAIKKLRKPTLGAWLANLLVHEHKKQVNELLQLGGALRAAQLNLAGAELRQLAQQRRQIIGTLISEARGLARRAGQPVADDAARELEATLSAALADESAAKTFGAGHLTSALEHVGFGALERIPGYVERSTAPDRRPARDGTAETKGVTSDGEARLRQRRAAERVLRDARAAVSDETQVLKERERELTQLSRARDERRSEVGDLGQQLQAAKSALASVERDLHAAEKARREIERKVQASQARVTRSADELDRVVGR